MFSPANKALKTSPLVAQKASGNAFFRKAGQESFFSVKEQPSFFGKPVQAKLTVSTPDDPHEREADAVADKVMRMQGPVMASAEPEKKEDLQRKEEEEIHPKQEAPALSKVECPDNPGQVNAKLNTDTSRSEEEQLDAKAALAAENETGNTIDLKTISLYPSDIMRTSGRGPPAKSIPFQQTLASSKGGGSTLPGDTRAFMESRFNADFGGVRIHTDRTAQNLSSQINAQAFANGNDIYFNSGKFSPGSTQGGILLAHELTHTLQQGASSINKSAENNSASIKDERRISKDAAKGLYPRHECSDGSSKAVKENSTISQNFSGETLQLKCACQQNEHLQLKEEISKAKPSNDSISPLVQANRSATDANPIKTFPKKEPNKNSDSSTENLSSSKNEEKSSLRSRKGDVKPQQKTKAGQSKGSSKAPSDKEVITAASSKGGAAGSGGSKSEIDPSSSEELLQSIATAPASSYIGIVSEGKKAVLQVQSQEKTDLSAGLPEVDQPTGLPTASRNQPVPTILSAGNAPSLKDAGVRTGAKPDLKHEEPKDPLPASKVSTLVSAAPPDDGGGNWWNWLVNQVQKFLGSIPTHDDGLSTSAGARPNVDLTGDADPGQTTHHQQISEQEITDQKTNADRATTATFGENEIYPTVKIKKLKSSYKPAAPAGHKASGTFKNPPLPESMHAEFDQHKTPELNAKGNEQIIKYQQEQEKYHQDSELTKQQGHQRITEETEKTRVEQQGMQQDAKAEVNAQKQSWRTENSKIHEQYATQSEAKRTEIDGQIKEKTESSEKQADQKLSEAEQKADEERKKTEREAAAKKQEEENKPHSFWDSVKDAVSSVFDALRKVVDGLFDALRSLVKGIIEAAKAIVDTIIEAARSVIVGLIKGFGAILKALVSIALAAFPALAAKARAWIDKKVNQAVDGVNAAAKRLEKAVDAALDLVGELLDKMLSVLQAIYNTLLDVMEFLTKGLIEIIELLTNLDELIKKVGGFINGLIDLMNNPGKIEAAAKETVKGYVVQIPAKAESTIQDFVDKMGKPAQKTAAPVIQKKDDPAATKEQSTGITKHLKGIWRHLKPGLEHIKANWWTEIKQMLWNMVWPFNDKSPLKKDATELYHLPAKILGSIWDKKFSQAVDQFLLMQQKLNSVIGLFYGWFFIASVLVGAIVGSIVPGPGTLAGAAAGAAFAGEVGEGLLLAMVATETDIILKAVYDLAFGPGTDAVNESAYDRIANSGLTLGITAVFVELSEIAGEIASELISGIKGIFKGEVPEVPGGKLEVPETKTDTPDTKGDTPEIKDLGTEGGKKVVAEEPTPDGHKVKVMEDGECLICSDCAKIRKEYALELSNPDPEIARINADLKAADSMPSNTPELAQLKAAEELKVRQDLEAFRLKEALALDKFSRSPAELDSLAKDPAHGNKLEAKGVHERKAALELEDQGELQGPVTRDPSGAAEFIDSTGKKWDMKSFDSRFPPKKGGFELNTDLGKIEAELNQGENVILDTTNLTPADAKALDLAVQNKGWSAKIRWYPRKP